MALKQLISFSSLIYFLLLVPNQGRLLWNETGAVKQAPGLRRVLHLVECSVSLSWNFKQLCSKDSTFLFWARSQLVLPVLLPVHCTLVFSYLSESVSFVSYSSSSFILGPVSLSTVISLIISFISMNCTDLPTISKFIFLVRQTTLPNSRCV